jgi:hypothetical protein
VLRKGKQFLVLNQGMLIMFAKSIQACLIDKSIRLSRQVPLVDQELLTLPKHMCSPPVFNITRSLASAITTDVNVSDGVDGDVTISLTTPLTSLYHLTLLVDSCYSIFSFICMFCRSLFVLLPFFFWPLCFRPYYSRKT